LAGAKTSAELAHQPVPTLEVTMSRLPFEIALMARDELLRHAADRQRANEAAARTSKTFRARRPKMLRRLLRLRQSTV
jgi:hypothetical protein